VTNSGTINNAVLNFGIPKGDKGDKGNPGDQAQSTIDAEFAAAAAAASASSAAASAGSAAASASAAGSAGAQAGAIAGADAATTEYETRVLSLESKTQFQSASTISHTTTFNSELDINDSTTGTNIIRMDNTLNAGSIRVGQASLSNTRIERTALTTQSVYSQYLDTPDVSLPMTIGYSASTINIGNPFTGLAGVPVINLNGSINFLGQVNFNFQDIIGTMYQF
jgi:hypothetical protein